MSDANPGQGQWFGQPEGLATLFFTEMWERFSYYGMRAILTLFMTAPVTLGGLGWPAEKAGPIYGLYTAMVYVTALPGGWIADKLIGQRKAVLLGGIIITAGHISLMFHGLLAFYLGLFLIVVGTGFLKPNISALVGRLYESGDARRDAGFSIFYMGINIGAFASPLVCGWLAQHSAFKTLLQNNGFDPVNSWHWGFGAAAVGMTLGVLQYLFGSSKAGVVFRWLTVVLLTGFLLLMLFVSGGTKVEVSGEMAQYSTTALVVGGIVAAAVIVLHLLWLLGYVLSGAGSRRFLLWGAVGSLVALVLVSGIIYSGSEYSDPAMVDESAIVTEPSVASDAVDTGTVGQESAANEVAAEEEAPPRNTTLLIVLILSALIVLGHSIWLFTRGNKVYAAIGVLVVLGLWAAKLDFIAADTGPVLLLVRIVSYLLPVFSYVYFAWIFQDRTWTPVERKRIYAIPVFFLGAAVFWSAFEQAGSTLTLFADRFTHNVLFSFPYPSSWFQSINALFIVLLAPVFAWAWVRLAKANREPSSPMKFAVGLYLLGVGFAVLAFGAVLSGSGGGLVGPQWLLSVYLLHTLGELCLSPVGLSTMTKLAPDRISGQMMGVWFLGAAIGNFIGGIVAGFFESFPLPLLFLAIFGFTLLATIVMLIIVKPIRALMSGVN